MKKSEQDALQASLHEGEERSHLTGQEIWNLTMCLLTWACTVSISTVVVGASNVIILSMGGNTNITALPLGAFFMGASLISCGITEPLFRRCGRKIGFWVGCGVGLLASGLGAVSLIVQSPTLNIITTFFFGVTNGIGFFLRFAAVELVPNAWKARAVTLVISGGVIAAFAGPETGHATRGMISNNEKLLFMGVYMMTGIFNIASMAFIGAVNFPPTVDSAKPATGNHEMDRSVQNGVTLFMTMYKSLLSTRSFLVPMLISTLFWAIMAVPMSMLRVAMKDAGYTSRQSLSAMELHFVGMYAPGFITGSLIERFGIRLVCWAGVVIAGMGLALNLISNTESEGTNGSALWLVGMIALGVGWNFCFTGASVGLTKTIGDVPYSKGEVQATNDSLMFFIAGIFVFTASFVYDEAFIGSGQLSGWQTLNYLTVGLLAVSFLVMAVDFLMDTIYEPANSKSEIVSIEIQDEDEKAHDENILNFDSRRENP